MDRPDWTGQPTGKTVRVGNASTEWQAADNRGRVGTREKAKQSQKKTELGPQTADTALDKHENASTLRHCLDEYRRQTKGTDEQYRNETLVCRQPEEGASNVEEAPGASHKAGSDSSDTAGTVAPAAMHQGTDRSDQMMRAQDPEKSYELFPAGTELCITADISRTYPVGMQGPVSERVPRWSVTRYAVVPLKERRASR